MHKLKVRIKEYERPNRWAGSLRKLSEEETTSSYAWLPRKNPANCALVKGLSKDVPFCVPLGTSDIPATFKRVPSFSSRFTDISSVGRLANEYRGSKTKKNSHQWRGILRRVHYFIRIFIRFFKICCYRSTTRNNNNYKKKNAMHRVCQITIKSLL